MRNLKITLTYDGTDFFGWQVQPGRATIQGALADVLKQITGEEGLPQGSGRTDAGVHALAQVATWQTRSPIPADNLVIALNDLLPSTIRVSRVEEVEPGFHARRSARAKTYEYRIYRAAICPPFVARYVWHYPYPLDEKTMQAAAPLVEGEKDYTSFTAVDPDCSARDEGDEDGRSNVRTVFSSEWKRDGEQFVYRVRGNGFLHHMVRNLVGTFLLVGKTKLRPDDIPRILAARHRSAAGATAPASGLFLVSVEY
jgi:tRNA pseudouridine38-40 synthase